MLFFISLLFIKISDINPASQGHTVINTTQTIENVHLSDSQCQLKKPLDGGAYFITSPAISVNITMCSFTSCLVESSRLAGYYTGGAVYICQIDNTFISDCQFVNCTSSRGGALGLSQVKFVNLDNCTFLENSAEYGILLKSYDQGGAIYFNDTSDCILDINNCVFDSNRADFGAAIYFTPELDEFNVYDCKFLNNWNNQYTGAAICNDNTDYQIKLSKSANIVSSEFYNNSVPGRGKGAIKASVIVLKALTLTLQGCNFTANEARTVKDCPVCSFTVGDVTHVAPLLLIDSCNVNSNIGSFFELRSSDCVDELKFLNCQFTNNSFFDSSLIRADLDSGINLPSHVTFDSCVFASNSNTYASTHANQLCIPAQPKTHTSIENCVFDGTNIKQSGPSLLIQSSTEISGTRFIHHTRSSTTIQVTKSTLSLKSIQFNDNSCTGNNKDGFICTTGNVTIKDITFSDYISVSDANYIIIDNATLSNNGIEATAENILISNAKFEADALAAFKFNASALLLVNNLHSQQTQKYVEFNGLNATSKVVVTDSTFETSSLKVSNALNCLINQTTFKQCDGPEQGGALHISQNVQNALVNFCTFNECQSNIEYGGALYSQARTNFTLHASSFTNCHAKSGKGSSVYVETGNYSLFINCTFVHPGDNNTASIYLDDKNSNSITVFVNDCFTSTDDAANQATHIYSVAKGTIYFNYPLCFDLSQENSVYFENGQQPYIGYEECFNCKDCGHMPYPGPTASPMPTETPSSHPPTPAPTQTPYPDPTQTPDDSKSKLSSGAIAGISIAAFLVVVALIFLTIYLVRRKKKDELGLDSRPLNSNNDGLPEGKDRVLQSVNRDEE